MNPLIPIFLIWATVAGHSIQSGVYDAPIPDRCASFDVEPEDQAFCKTWKVEHRRPHPAPKPLLGTTN